MGARRSVAMPVPEEDEALTSSFRHRGCAWPWHHAAAASRFDCRPQRDRTGDGREAGKGNPHGRSLASAALSAAGPVKKAVNLCSAHDFPKFVTVGAAMEHELRNRDASASNRLPSHVPSRRGRQRACCSARVYAARTLARKRSTSSRRFAAWEFSFSADRRTRPAAEPVSLAASLTPRMLFETSPVPRAAS